MASLFTLKANFIQIITEFKNGAKTSGLES